MVARYVLPAFSEWHPFYPPPPGSSQTQNSVALEIFWNELGRDTLSLPPPATPIPPEYMDPRPRTWLGQLSKKSALRLFSVTAYLHSLMARGYNTKKSYVIWCANGCGGAGACHGAKDRIQLTDRFFNRDRIEFSGRHARPCDAQRLLMHEILHFSGHGLNDQLYWHPDSENSEDRGPCGRINPLGDDGRRKCYHGFCATRMAHENSNFQSTHNVDSYAYLIRNIGLHWVSEVTRNPANFPLPLQLLSGTACAGEDCGAIPGTNGRTPPPVWPGRPCPDGTSRC